MSIIILAPCHRLTVRLKKTTQFFTQDIFHTRHLIKRTQVVYSTTGCRSVGVRVVANYGLRG